MDSETEKVEDVETAEEQNSDGGDETVVQSPFLELSESGVSPEADEEKCAELLRDVSLKVKVELGRGKMHLEDILRLTKGSVVELDKLAGDALDIYVNNRLVARGDVLVLNENFCVRITEILTPEERFRMKVE